MPLPSLEESLQYLHDSNVRVDPVVRYVMPQAIAGLRNRCITIPESDEDPLESSSPVDASCCLAFHEKQDRTTKGQTGSSNRCMKIAAGGRAVLWKTNSTLKYYFSDTIPKEHRQLLQAALIVGIHVWNRLLPVNIEQTFHPSEATHLLQARDLSEEFEDDVVGFGEFPEAGKQRHLVISTKALTGPHIKHLLSRFLHEMGHNMGFYHEFPAAMLGVKIGVDSPLSIMGHDWHRIITTQDVRSFYHIYNLPHGTKVSNYPLDYIEKIDPYTDGGLDDQMDRLDELADLVQVFEPMSDEEFDQNLPSLGVLPSSHQFVRLALKTMTAAADELGYGTDGHPSYRLKRAAKTMTGITRSTNCSVISLSALQKDSIIGCSHDEVNLASVCLIQLATQIAAVAIMKLKKGLQVTIGGLTYKPPMPEENSPWYAHKCAELHSQAFWEVVLLKGLVSRESESSFARSISLPTRRNESSDDVVTDTIVEDILATTLSYLDTDALNAIKRKFRNDFPQSPSSPSKCVYGFTNCVSGSGDSIICRITFYKVLTMANQHPNKQRTSCGKPWRMGSRGKKRVEYRLHYESVTLLPHVMVQAFRTSREVRSSLLSSFFGQLSQKVAAALYLEPGDVEQKSWGSLRRELRKDNQHEHPSKLPHGSRSAAAAAEVEEEKKEE